MTRPGLRAGEAETKGGDLEATQIIGIANDQILWFGRHKYLPSSPDEKSSEDKSELGKKKQKKKVDMPIKKKKPRGAVKEKKESGK